jgi:hypothetical protein
VSTAEEILKRKIRILVLRADEVEHMKDSLRLDKALVVWTANGAES